MGTIETQTHYTRETNFLRLTVNPSPIREATIIPSEWAKPPHNSIKLHKITALSAARRGPIQSIKIPQIKSPTP